MASRLQLVHKKQLVHPPKWLPANVHYEVMGGSVSYGVSSDTSDMDITGFCIPPKDMIFPHLRGEIPGFGAQVQRFDVWQEHHIIDKETSHEYDFAIYSIVKFFQLTMENNPNMLDVLYTPQRCVLYCTPVAQMVRDNRKLFLHKGAYHKLRGYSYAQLHKIGTKANAKNPKRQADINNYGFDLKFAYHVVRLLLQAEQILVEHDLDIERNSEILKSIRKGEWTEEKIRSWFDAKELALEELYSKSTLQNKPPEDEIKTLLLTCLEHHYGSMTEAIRVEVPVDKMIRELKAVLEKYEG